MDPLDALGEEELQQLVRAQQEQISQLAAQVVDLKARLGADAEFEDLSFHGLTYQPHVVAELARSLQRDLMPVRLLSAAERKAEAKLPKLRRLGESIADHDRRWESDPRMVSAMKLHKGTPGNADKRPLEALRAFEELAQAGCLAAQYYAATLTHKLYSFTDWPRTKSAIRSMFELAIRGYTKAHVFLAQKCLLMHMLDNDLNRTLMNAAVELGEWRAAAHLIRTARGETKEKLRGILMSAAPTNPSADFALRYFDGASESDRQSILRESVATNPKVLRMREFNLLPDAFSLLEQLAAAGCSRAKVQLAVLYMNELREFLPFRWGPPGPPITTTRNVPRAIELLQAAAKNNDVAAAGAVWGLAGQTPKVWRQLCGTAHPDLPPVPFQPAQSLARSMAFVPALRLSPQPASSIRRLKSTEPLFPAGHLLSVPLLNKIICSEQLSLRQALRMRLVSKAWLQFLRESADLNVRLFGVYFYTPWFPIRITHLRAEGVLRGLDKLCGNLVSLHTTGVFAKKELHACTGLTALNYHAVSLPPLYPLVPPPYRLPNVNSSLQAISTLTRLNSISLCLEPYGGHTTVFADAFSGHLVDSLPALTNLKTLVLVNPAAALQWQPFTSLTGLHHLALQSTTSPPPPPPHQGMQNRLLPAATLISLLTPLTQLRSLDISKQYLLGGAQLATLLAHMPHLTSLGASARPLAPVLQALVTHQPHLRGLSFACDAEADQLGQLSQLVDLTALRVHYHMAKDLGLAALSKLTYLELSSDCLDQPRTAKLLNSLPKLRHFGAVLDNCKRDMSPPQIARTSSAQCALFPTTITSLRLEVAPSLSTFASRNFGAGNLPVLFARLPQLQALHMTSASMSLTHQDLRPITMLTNLRSLQVEYTACSPEFLTELLRHLPNLEPHKIRWVLPSGANNALGHALLRMGISIPPCSAAPCLTLRDVFVTNLPEDV